MILSIHHFEFCEARENRIKKLLFILAKATCGALVLVFLFSIVDLKGVEESLSKANPIPFGVVCFLVVLSPLITALRLKAFLEVVDFFPTFSNALRATLCGFALNVILPARGGDLAKVAFLCGENHKQWSKLSGAVILERSFDLLALGLIGLLASLITSNYKSAPLSGLVVFTCIFGMVFFSKFHRLPILGPKLKNFNEAFRLIIPRRRKVFRGFLVSILCWTNNCLIIALLLQSIDRNFHIWLAYSAAPPSIFVGILPISLWGVGTRDAALAYFLDGSTLIENIMAAGFLYTALVYWLLGLIGVPALLYSRKSREVIQSSIIQENQ